ncbi:MAG: hypothetical protein H7Y15_07735, partial [Pseudonocardia sp.]|nr:hypothetical protein [Pseudonocardia sp.]
VGWLRDGSWAGLAGYSADRLRSVHRTVEFTSWFLRALHTSRGPAVLTRALASPDAARMLADRYVS